MIQAQSPFSQFFDLSGTPLDNGYIYIGQPNLNPETSPITAYWDEAGTLPAAQPIRTSGGYPSRNGAPARIFTNALDYSMTVRDKNSALVSYSPSISSYFGGIGIQVVNTYATLRTIAPASNRRIRLGYGAKPGDGAEGDFYGVTGAAPGTYTDNIGTIIVPTGGDGSSAWLRDDDIITPEMFLAVGDGITSDSTALQAVFTLASSANYSVRFKPGAIYYLDSQVTITAPSLYKMAVYGYGAEIITSGAISGLKITGGSVNGGVDLFGVKINHRGNASATFGFDILGSWNAHLYSCVVEAHGVNATYAAFHVAQSDPADTNTGSFWTVIENCWARKRSGTDVGDITYGVQVQGSANATTIRGGGLNNCTTGVYNNCHSGQTYLANALLVEGVAFESYTTAINIDGATTSNIGGHRFIGNRFENGTTIFSLTTTTTQPSVAPVAMGNYMISSAGTYLNNPNNLYFNSLDMSITPSISGKGMTFKQDLSVEATSAAAFPLIVKTVGGSRGIRLATQAGTKVLDAVWTGTGSKCAISGLTAGDVQFNCLSGISGTTAHANNLRGTVTLAAGTANVTFPTAEADANYFVALGGNATESFGWSAKATTGFTITSSNAASTAIVNWILIR